MHGHRFNGALEMLRSPARIALLEPAKVVDACFEGIDARSVLDVGTGTGLFVERFARRAEFAAGVDVEPRMVARARILVPGAKFAVSPAETLPYHDRTFDLVFLGLVLHETDDAERALAEAARVVRKRVGILEWPYVESEPGPPLAHRLSPTRIQDLASDAGLRFVGQHQLGMLQLWLAEPTPLD